MGLYHETINSSSSRRESKAKNGSCSKNIEESIGNKSRGCAAGGNQGRGRVIHLVCEESIGHKRKHHASCIA
jgi:hypothetical protein